MDRRTPSNNVSAVPPTQQHAMYAPRLAYHLNGDVNHYVGHHQPPQSMPLTVAPNLLSVPVTSGSGGYGSHDALALANHSLGSRWPSVYEQEQQRHQQQQQQQQQQQHHQHHHQHHQSQQQQQQQQNGRRAPPFHDLHDILDPVPLRPSTVQPSVLAQTRSPSFTLPLLSQTVSPPSYTSGYPIPTPPPPDFASSSSGGSGYAHQQAHAHQQQQQQHHHHQQQQAAQQRAASAAGWQAHAARSIGGAASSAAVAPVGGEVSSVVQQQPAQEQRAVGRQGTRGILPSAPLGRDDMSAATGAAPEDEIDPQQDPSTKKWMCPSCPATFSFPKHVKRHYMRHTGERPYECLCCRACFARSDVLKRHYEKCTERTPGWRDVAPEDRLDHLHGRRGRPKKVLSAAAAAAAGSVGSGGKKMILPGNADGHSRSKRRRAGSIGTSGQSSEQNSRRNSRDELAAAAALQQAVAESEEFNKQTMALAGDELAS